MKVLFNSRGQSVNIDCDPSMTIAALKDELQGTTGVNPQYQEVVLFTFFTFTFTCIRYLTPL